MYLDIVGPLLQFVDPCAKPYVETMLLWNLQYDVVVNHSRRIR